MEFIGKILQINELQSGVSKAGKEWKKITFVVETHDQYPKKGCFIMMNDRAENLIKYQKVGDEVKVSFDIDSREFNGRWYTDLSAWRVEKVTQEAAAPQPSAPTPPPAPQPQNIAAATQPVGTSHVEDESELPF